MKLSTEKTVKKLKLNVFNIKSLLVFNRKKVDKIKKEKKRFSLFERKKKNVKEKEEKVESPRTMGSTLKNIAGALLAKPKSIIDKFKEFFGIILLGILVNNLPLIIKKIQSVLGKIKKFFDDNPWIGTAIKFTFDIIAKGMMGILDLTKTLMPVIGGSFKFALDTIKTAKNEIGLLIKFFDDLGGGIGALMTSFGYKPPAKAAQAYAKSKGKYYSSTTGKTYGSYSQALKNPQVKKGAQQYANQKAQKAQAAPAPGYDPKTGTSLILQGGTNKPVKGAKPVILAPITRNGRTTMGAMDPNDKSGTASQAPKSWKPVTTSKQENERYQAVNQANKVQKLSVGGTIRNFFGGMFGGSRRGLGNIPPQEGTGRGGPSDITLTTKDGGKSYAGPYASPTGTAKGRKARETVNYFKVFENNIDLQNRRLKKEENNLSLFNEFMKSYENLSKLRKKYGEQYNTPGPTPPGESGPPLISGEIYLAEGGILPSAKPGRGNNGPRSDTSHGYPARDYQIEVGQPISVFVPGVVHYAGNQNPNGYGNEVIIKHTNGTYTQYAHLSQILVKKGDVIESGQTRVIGKTGGAEGAPGSGNSGGPHLHFEVRDANGSAVTQYNSGDNYFRFGGRVTVKKQKPSTTPGGSNEEIVRNFFRGRGLSEIAVAGILGNAYEESTFNPTIAHSVAGNKGKFIGIFQWGNKGDGDRWGSLTKFAKENNMNRESIQTQLLFTVEEMNSGSKYYDSGAGTAYQLIQKAKTPEEAAEIWREHFERGPGKQAERKRSARRFYEKYKDKPLPKVLPVTLAQQAQTEEEIIKTMKSLGVTEKFFPQDKQRIKIVKGADGKEKIQVIDTGFLNMGLFGGQLKGISPQTWKKLLNYLQYEYNKRQEEKNRPGPGASSYGGGDGGDQASVTIIDRPSVAVLREFIEQPYPVNRYIGVPVAQTSPGVSLNSRALIS